MFLDKVDSNNDGGNGYIDDDEPEEDDDELRDDLDEDGQIDEEVDQDDDEEISSPNNVRSQAGVTTNYSQSNGHTEFTTKSTNAMFSEDKRSAAGQKSLVKRKSIKRKPVVKSKKSDLRTGYNEGAEENKNWLGDSQSTFTNETNSVQNEKTEVKL